MTHWITDEAARARARAMLEEMEADLPAIELAAAIVDGGIPAKDLTHQDLEILLAVDTLDVVASMLREGRPLAVSDAPAAAGTSDSGEATATAPPSMNFLDHVRRWSAPLGGLAAAAVLAIAAIIALQPSRGLDWRMPATIGDPSLVKTPIDVPESDLLAHLMRGESKPFVIDHLLHDDGQAVTLGLGRFGSDSTPRPFAVVTFQTTPDSSRTGAISLPTRGSLLDQALFKGLSDSGLSRFAVTTIDGQACWGTMVDEDEFRIDGRWDPGSGSWAAGDTREGSVAPPLELAMSHRLFLQKPPISPTSAWSLD